MNLALFQCQWRPPFRSRLSLWLPADDVPEHEHGAGGRAIRAEQRSCGHRPAESQHLQQRSRCRHQLQPAHPGGRSTHKATYTGKLTQSVIICCQCGAGDDLSIWNAYPTYPKVMFWNPNKQMGPNTDTDASCCQK